MVDNIMCNRNFNVTFLLNKNVPISNFGVTQNSNNTNLFTKIKNNIVNNFIVKFTLCAKLITIAILLLLLIKQLDKSVFILISIVIVFVYFGYGVLLNQQINKSKYLTTSSALSSLMLLATSLSTKSIATNIAVNNVVYGISY